MLPNTVKSELGFTLSTLQLWNTVQFIKGLYREITMLAHPVSILLVLSSQVHSSPSKP